MYRHISKLVSRIQYSVQGKEGALRLRQDYDGHSKSHRYNASTLRKQEEAAGKYAFRGNTA